MSWKNSPWSCDRCKKWLLISEKITKHYKYHEHNRSYHIIISYHQFGQRLYTVMHRATLRQFLCQGFLFCSHQLWSCPHSWHEIWRPCRSVVLHTWYLKSTEFIRIVSRLRNPILLPVASVQQAMSSTWFHALWLLCAGKIPLEHGANHVSMKVEYQIQRSIPRRKSSAQESFKISDPFCNFQRLGLKPQDFSSRHSLQRVSHVPSERSMPSCWYQRHSSHQNPELGTAEWEDKNLTETCTSLQHAQPTHSFHDVLATISSNLIRMGRGWRTIFNCCEAHHSLLEEKKQSLSKHQLPVP